VVTEQPPAGGRLVGGIDFGLRNPFAAVWGVVDRNNVLWLTGEHFSRERSLSYHAQHMPKNVTWYADPAGAQEIKELHCAGFTVRRGFNPQRPGIAAVKARLEHFGLRIVQGACPNLLAEAELYRYDPDYPDSEKPKKENDHALDALRYLVGRIDEKRTALWDKPKKEEPPGQPPAASAEAKAQKKWLSYHNEALWTTIGYINRH
jgi:hypothetical protein